VTLLFMPPGHDYYFDYFDYYYYYFDYYFD
jgi:hypothetical protein